MKAGEHDTWHGEPGVPGEPGVRFGGRVGRSVSLVIAVLCGALFLAVWACLLLRVASREELLTGLGLSCHGIVGEHRFYQFLTAPLLHGGVWHLVFNLLSLLLLGPALESAMGRAGYIIFSLVCAVASMAGFLLVNRDNGSVCLGYSGVVFGLLVAYASFYPNQCLPVLGFFPLKMRHAVLLLGAVEFYLVTSPESGGVANAAHLFGGIAGFGCIRARRFWKAGRDRARMMRAEAARKSRRREAMRRVPREL